MRWIGYRSELSLAREVPRINNHPKTRNHEDSQPGKRCVTPPSASFSFPRDKARLQQSFVSLCAGHSGLLQAGGASLKKVRIFGTPRLSLTWYETRRYDHCVLPLKLMFISLRQRITIQIGQFKTRTLAAASTRNTQVRHQKTKRQLLQGQFTVEGRGAPITLATGFCWDDCIKAKATLKTRARRPRYESRGTLIVNSMGNGSKRPIG